MKTKINMVMKIDNTIRIKITVVFVFLLLIQNEIYGTELSPSERHQIALICIRQTGIQRSVIEEAKIGNIPKNNTKYKEFLTCSYKKQRFQDENGEILIDNVKKFLQKFYSSTDLAAVDICKHAGPNHGDNAFNALQCIIPRLRNMTVVNQE